MAAPGDLVDYPNRRMTHSMTALQNGKPQQIKVIMRRLPVP
jgi:hypothetical protein